MARLAIIADDLTGAADSAVAFAARGHPTHVLLDPAYDSSADVVAVTSESRHRSPSDAAECVRQIAQHLTGAPWLYKKIDSTLRGNPAEELLALMEEAAEPRALIAPAFPAQGRTTIQGKQLLGGVALEETSFSREITTSHLPQLFRNAGEQVPLRLIELPDVRQGSTRISALLADASPGVIIVDAMTDADLDAIAEAALAAGIRLLCGSAGLCHALARLIPPRPVRQTNAAQQPISIGPILTIAGSRHPTTIAQVDAARASGIRLIEPAAISSGEIERQIDLALNVLQAGDNLIIASHQIEDASVSGNAVVDWLAHLTRRNAERVPLGGLILTGGDVASAVCLHLGIRAIDLYGEVQPGIPWGFLRGGLLDRLPVITKAGGFGASDALVTAIAFLYDK